MMRVALITAYNGSGQLLVGKRNDNSRYTLPGGHLEEGEDPAAGALRELFEETGLHAQTLSYLTEYTTKAGVELHCFSAFVTGTPHGKHDPDQEVDEWEFVDVAEGLAPKVYDHLHGPQDDDNIVKKLFDLKKSEVLEKRAKLWHSDDWGTARVSIPSAEHPDRPRYDKNYLNNIRSYYSADVRPLKVSTEQLTTTNEVHDQSRFKLYRKMFRAGDRLPPIVVKKTPSGYQVLDGNHKVHAARAEGGGHLHAVELVHDQMPHELRTAKMAKADLDPNAGYRLEPKTYAIDGHTYTSVRAYPPKPAYEGEHVGLVEFHHNPEEGSIKADSVYVHEGHRRQGLATAMYKLAEKHTGMTAVPSDNQTGEGQVLWQGMRKAEEDLEKVALDPNSGYTIQHKISHHVNYYETDPAKRNFQVLSVSAHAPGGEEVGRAILGDDDNGRFSVSHVHVKPAHRRIGLASAMYAHGEKVAGKKLHPSQAQTEDGQALWAGNAVAPQFGKAEDEVHRLLDHPDVNERTMALKLDGVRPEHALAAALDSRPEVYSSALDHSLFGPSEGLQLMEAARDKDGNYPEAQKNAYLMRHAALRPYHFNAYANSALMAGPEVYDRAAATLATHPGTPAELLRKLYLDSDVGHGPRQALLDHPSVPSDVLDHALETALRLQDPSAARGAVANRNMLGPTLSRLVARAADRGEGPVVELAHHALANNVVGEDVFRHLLAQATVKPTSAAPRLLSALISGPTGATLKPQDVDYAVSRAQQAGPAEVVMKSLADHPLFAARHLSQILAKAEEKLADSPPPSGAQLASHPVISDQLGFLAEEHPAFRAAKFLSGAAPTQESIRRALYNEDGDVERAALLAYGLPCSDANIDALHAVIGLSDLGKFEAPEPNPTAEHVVASHPEAEDVAEMLQRAFRDNFVFPVALGGKHSKGSMLAFDNQTHTTILLKSGSGGAGGAAGSAQDPSNPNAREAAFYHIACEWGIQKSFPRAELVLVDGRPYAALQLLDTDFKTLDKAERHDPGIARQVLAPYLYDGVLHQWAVIDYVLGNPDRHGQNVMVDPKKDVKLIDHGSAFAGTMFDPARDKNSFVPYYLRAWCLEKNFNQMTPEDKLRSLPRVSTGVGRRLNQWVAGLKPEVVEMFCTRYGIDPAVCLARLDLLQKSITDQHPTDETVNGLWVTT